MGNSRLDEFLAIDRRCSVTAFDMHVQVHRDGRERGLWIGLNDTSEARAKTYKRWLDDACETFCKLVGVTDADISMRFRVAINRDEIGRLLASTVEEAALIEWAELLEIYDAIGTELQKFADKNTDKNVAVKPVKATKAKKAKKRASK